METKPPSSPSRRNMCHLKFPMLFHLWVSDYLFLFKLSTKKYWTTQADTVNMHIDYLTTAKTY